MRIVAESLASRLRWLIAGQLGLGLLQVVAAAAPPFNDAYAPVVWALVGTSIEPAMILGFWCVFSFASLRLKVCALLFGALYFALISVAYHFVVRWTIRAALLPFLAEGGYLRDFAEDVVRSVFFLAGLVCAVWLLRFGLWQVGLENQPRHAETSNPTQFSIKQLLAVTLLAAICLALARAYRYPWPEGLYDGRDWIGNSLLTLTLSLNTLLAGWATLSNGPLRTRICVALPIALLTGLIYCAASTIDRVTAVSWLIYTLLLIELPTAILIGSLLVVRSCGYRLVARQV